MKVKRLRIQYKYFNLFIISSKSLWTEPPPVREKWSAPTDQSEWRIRKHWHAAISCLCAGTEKPAAYASLRYLHNGSRPRTHAIQMKHVQSACLEKDGRKKAKRMQIYVLRGEKRRKNLPKLTLIYPQHFLQEMKELWCTFYYLFILKRGNEPHTSPRPWLLLD